jgi:membrane protein YdbS with pleckstrin-like domain
LSLYARAKAVAGRWLRIPPPPANPAGSPGSVRRFQAAPGYFRYRVAGWGLKQVGALWGLIVGLTMVGLIPDELPLPIADLFGWLDLLRWVEVVSVALFVLQLPFSLFLVRLDYDNRWYLVTDRSLRIREGVVKVHEQTMSFANLQNLSIRQGPLQRLFGIADLQVRTAGGGGKGDSGQKAEGDEKNLHLAFFRGVSNAEEIRDLILAHLRRLKGSGLGDPDEEDEVPPVPSDALAAAREVLAEARALRRGAGPGP